MSEWQVIFFWKKNYSCIFFSQISVRKIQFFLKSSEWVTAIFSKEKKIRYLCLYAHIFCGFKILVKLGSCPNDFQNHASQFFPKMVPIFTVVIPYFCSKISGFFSLMIFFPQFQGCGSGSRSRSIQIRTFLVCWIRKKCPQIGIQAKEKKI